jgi:hypothetical protein
MVTARFGYNPDGRAIGDGIAECRIGNIGDSHRRPISRIGLRPADAEGSDDPKSVSCPDDLAAQQVHHSMAGPLRVR